MPKNKEIDKETGITNREILCNSIKNKHLYWTDAWRIYMHMYINIYIQIYKLVFIGHYGSDTELSYHYIYLEISLPYQAGYFAQCLTRLFFANLSCFQKNSKKLFTKYHCKNTLIHQKIILSDINT